MSVLTSRPVLRWLVPATAAAAVIGGGVAIGSLATAAEPDLPPRTAAQLLVDLQTARHDGLSGTVVQRANLGLPPITGLAGGAGGAADLATLLSGKNTLRVWYAGPDKARVALMGSLGESDMIRNGKDVWTWNSRSKEATHATLDEGAAGAPSAEHSPPAGLPSTPQEAADAVLEAIDPSTAVTVDRTARIAGRDAYQLVLSPRDTASLVGRINVAIDATEHVPLRFQVFARGATDVAFEAAFTQISFDRPDDAQFRFNPPPGTTVKEEKDDGAPAPDKATPERKAPAGQPGTDDGPRPVGTGWTTVLVAKTGSPASGQGEEAAQARSILGQLPAVSGSWGSGRLFSSELFTVLLTDDGRLLGGFVTPERLYEVAAQK
jgi:outer membrane lipoprotein-sorting protein